MSGEDFFNRSDNSSTKLVEIDRLPDKELETKKKKKTKVCIIHFPLILPLSKWRVSH